MQPYFARRQQLIERMNQQGGGVAIISTAPEVMRNRDADYPYRHDSYFYYLTGFTEPEATLVLIAGKSPRSILFCRDKNAEREIWDGYRYGPQAAQTTFGFDEAYAIDTIDQHIPTLLANQPALYYNLADHTKLDRQVRKWLTQVRSQNRAGTMAPHAAYDVRHFLDEMRLFKDIHELGIMRRAATISAEAHIRAMQTARPGLCEYHLEAELLYHFRKQGAQAPAYGSIVAAGANACVLHYRAGNAVLQAGDLCLIDAACELDGYASDITRTFPVSGRFSGPQRDLYDIVLAAQAAAISQTRAGNSWQAPHDAAVQVLAQGMLDVGLIQAQQASDASSVIEQGLYRQFYMHRTGHWIGMDVHDVGEYRDIHASGDAKPWRTLQPGMTLTVEPGLYVRPAPDVPAHFWHIGIRIEDDVVVTEQDCEILTHGVPKTVAAIEALMQATQ